MKRNACAELLIKIDIFGQPFQFGMPDKKKIFKTVPGAICTILLFFVIAIYAGYKIATLVSKSQYQLVRESFQYHYDAEDTFDEKRGFAIAAVVSAFGDASSYFDEPEYGRIKFVMKSWSGDQPLKFKELALRQCTRADFEEGNEFGFYPLHEKMGQFS